MKYSHEVIRDLMPLCVDGIASPESEQIVEEHLAECPACAAEWAQMQHAAAPEPAVPLPEDTGTFAQAARRVRRHNRLKTCWILAGMLLGAAAFVLIISYRSGSRFTMKGLAEVFVRDSIGESLWEEQHDDSEPRPKQYPMPEYQYLGALWNADKTAATGYIYVKHPDKELYTLACCDGARNDRFNLHLMLQETGGGWGFEPPRTGILMNEGGSCLDDGRHTYSIGHAAGFYVTDPQVRRISVIAGSRSYQAEPDANGFCAILMDNRNQWISQGEATDADGNVCYRIGKVQKTTDHGETYEIYDWIPADAS